MIGDHKKVREAFSPTREGMREGKAGGRRSGVGHRSRARPWCKTCERVVPLSEARPMANGNYYYHVIPRPATQAGSGAREQRCGSIEWRTSLPERGAP